MTAPSTARAARYVPPVVGRVVDPFRAPVHEYGPGNRGLEYAVGPGAPVRSIGPGVVAFAGPVAGRLVVSVVHPDGLRSSLTGLSSVRVRVGQLVDATSVVGTAGARLHLGVRRAGRYIDPASLFAASRPTRSVLVPAGAGPGGTALGRRRAGPVHSRPVQNPWIELSPLSTRSILSVARSGARTGSR